MATVDLQENIEAVVEREPEGLYEIVDGQVVEKNVAILETRVITLLGTLIEVHVGKSGLGMAFVEALYRMDPNSRQQRRPDVSFVSRERWPDESELPSKGTFDVAPDLAIEVVSPTDLATDVQAKVAEYFRGGVRQVWSVYARLGVIVVHEPGGVSRTYDRGQTIEVDPIIAGFRLPVAEVLPAPRPSEEPSPRAG